MRPVPRQARAGPIVPSDWSASKGSSDMTQRGSVSRPAEDVFAAFGRLAILPLIEIDDSTVAVRLGEILLEEGLPCAEVTFRTRAAPDAIAALSRDLPDLLVGAGTIVSTRQVDDARQAGASFLVSPGFDPVVVRHATDLGLPVVPGVCTPSEIQAAGSHGLSVLKFFPAEVAGGVPFLKAVAPVYPGTRFIPTGGIGPANLGAYLELPTVLACGGSWMMPRRLVAGGDLGAIRALVRDAVDLVRAIRDDSHPEARIAIGGTA